MTFVDALRTASGASYVFRSGGPILRIDILGQITVIHGLTLGDILDMDDWRISKRL